MPIMNSYSVVVVDQCVDANLLRRSAYKVFYAGNVQHVISSTIKITEKAFLSVISLHSLQCSRPFSIYMVFTGSFIRFA